MFSSRHRRRRQHCNHSVSKLVAFREKVAHVFSKNHDNDIAVDDSDDDNNEVSYNDLSSNRSINDSINDSFVPLTQYRILSTTDSNSYYTDSNPPSPIIPPDSTKFINQIISKFDYFLMNDANIITIKIYSKLIENLRTLLNRPYWNYSINEPILKNLNFSNNLNLLNQFESVSIINGTSLKTFLQDLRKELLIHQSFYNQKLNGENMRFLNAFKIKSNNSLISNDIVPILIIGVVCIRDLNESNESSFPKPKLHRYYKNVDPTDSIPIPIELDKHHDDLNIFNNFNNIIKEIEQQSYYSIKGNPLYQSFNEYEGPKFEIKPICFTDHSTYRWQLIELNHIFPKDDPILGNLSTSLEELNKFLSIPNYPTKSNRLLIKPIFQTPNFENLLYQSINYYTPINLKNYLKPKPWGYQRIINMHTKNNVTLNNEFFTEVENGDSCSICLIEFNENDLCLHLNCKHFFHNVCIEQWIQNSNSNKCPLCRKTINYLS